MWRFAPDLTYLNHAAFGAVPIEAQRRQARLRAEMEANPTDWFRRLDSRMRDASVAIAGVLGADPHRTALVSNASAAATVALSALELRRGEDILVTDDIYGAVGNAVKRAAHRAGATVRVAHLPLEADSDAMLALLLSEVGDRTAAVVLDQITSSTFRMLPTAALAHAVAPVPVLVDGAHAAGLVAHAASLGGGTLWFGNLHKFLAAPRSSAALVAAPGFDASRLRPPIASWGEDAPFPERFDQQGTGDHTAALVAAWSIDRLERLVGWDRIRRHAEELAAVARGWADLEVGSPAPGAALVPVGPVVTSGEEARSLAARLSALGLEIGVTAWNGRGFLRMSGHAYSTREDLERARAVLIREGVLDGQASGRAG